VQTFQAKFIAPALHLVARLFLIGLLHPRLFPDIDRQTFQGGTMHARFEDAFRRAWVLCRLATFWRGWQLKRSAADDEPIYVSNYVSEAKLPLSARIEARETVG